MAVTVTPSTLTPMTYGDTGSTVSMSGGTTSNYLWSSDTGTFANRFASSTTFSPKNNTATSIIRASTIEKLTINPTYVSALASGRGYQKSGGSNGTWDASVTSTNYITVAGVSNSYGFIEFESNENTTEKACGLTSNATYKDPTTVHTSNSFILAWHLYSDGTAVPRNKGIAVAAPVPYEDGDIFRIEISENLATFKLRGFTVGQAYVASSTTLYGMTSFKNSSASIENASFLRDTVGTWASTGTGSVEVTGVLPVQPNYGVSIGEDNPNTLVSEAEDGTKKFRVLGSNKATFNLQYTARPFTEYTLLKDFWRFHQKHTKFFYETSITNETYLVRFTSASFVFLGADVYNIQFTIEQA